MTAILSPVKESEPWEILYAFADGRIKSLPKTEERLQECLGTRYRYEDWKPAFDAIFNAEDDIAAAIDAVWKLANNARHPTNKLDQPRTSQNTHP